MTAFERQVAGEVVRAMGPPRPVEDLAIFNAVATQTHKWRFQFMFGATKFVVAAAIVALFGGFLLTGVLSQRGDDPRPAVGTSTSASPEKSTRADLLPGVDLVTEEVEPGVFRVISDGIRKLSRKTRPRLRRNGVADSAIIAGLDGSVWHFRPGGFYRLGDEARHEYGPGNQRHVWVEDDIEVGPDGTIWWVKGLRFNTASDTAKLLSYDGGAWTLQREGLDGKLSDVEVTSDGDVWAAWKIGRQAEIARLVDGEWQVVGSLPGGRRMGGGGSTWEDDTFEVADDGDVWFRGRQENVLKRYDGSAWRDIPLGQLVRSIASSDDELARIRAITARGVVRTDVGPDGTLWIQLSRGDEDENPILVRSDGTTASLYDDPDLPSIEYGDHLENVFEVAPDGSLWYGSSSSLPGQDQACGGMVRVDDGSVTSYLQGLCVHAADIAPDGSVWVQAGEPEGPTIETYLIRPEAAMASE